MRDLKQATDPKTLCRLFDNGAGTTCIDDLGLSWAGFESPGGNALPTVPSQQSLCKSFVCLFVCSF